MLPERTDSSLSQRTFTVEVTMEGVVVAVRAEKVISKTALAWALTHIVHPGDGITFACRFPSRKIR